MDRGTKQNGIGPRNKGRGPIFQFVGLAYPGVYIGGMINVMNAYCVGRAKRKSEEKERRERAKRKSKEKE
ncbi:hypothetical protein JA9_002342 [Meyerozyma sp. JA9]|nr:hypothetical protein JA9_002342 [Meyerozyma sp. JA9]